MSEFIGQQEVYRRDHGLSVGVSSLRDGQSISTRIVQEHIILPEDLAKLNPLHGVLAFTGNFPVCYMSVDYLPLDGNEDGFMEDKTAIERAEVIFTGAKSTPEIQQSNARTTVPNASSKKASLPNATDANTDNENNEEDQETETINDGGADTSIVKELTALEKAALRKQDSALKIASPKKDKVDPEIIKEEKRGTKILIKDSNITPQEKLRTQNLLSRKQPRIVNKGPTNVVG